MLASKEAFRDQVRDNLGELAVYRASKVEKVFAQNFGDECECSPGQIVDERRRRGALMSEGSWLTAMVPSFERMLRMQEPVESFQEKVSLAKTFADAWTQLLGGVPRERHARNGVILNILRPQDAQGDAPTPLS